MNRKLHNTISALMVSGAVLVLGLMAANPAGLPSPQAHAPQQPVSEALAQATAFDAELATATELTNPIQQVPATEPAVARVPHHRKSGKTSRIRQSMAMPYFSFVSRG